MNAKITYRMGYSNYLLPEPQRKQGRMAWHLMKITEPEIGGYSTRSEEAVAIFSSVNEAQIFQAHIFAKGLDGELVSIDSNLYQQFTRGRL